MALLGTILVMLFVACRGVENPARAENGTPPSPAREKTREAPATSLKPVPPEEVAFSDSAFPPTISDVKYHQTAWLKNDCLRCHETGVEDAPEVRHEGMPEILLTAMCRSCHLLIPGQAPVKRLKKKEDDLFAAGAFPPMIPASGSHREAWYKDSCLLCHERPGLRGAPVVQHRDLPKVLLKAKCRSCHVQVRSSSLPDR